VAVARTGLAAGALRGVPSVLRTLPTGYIIAHPETGKLVIKTEHGWVDLDKGRLPKEMYPELYAVLSEYKLVPESRWRRLKRWLLAPDFYVPPLRSKDEKECVYGETEHEFNLPDLRGRVVE
jgi:hypothetical protein